MQIQDLVKGLPNLKSALPTCTHCIFGKQSKSAYPLNHATCATEVLALVHTYLCGPMHTPSVGGALYFIIFIDNYSRFTHLYFLSKKSDTFSKFLQYKALVENHTSHKILILRSDNGG